MRALLGACLAGLLVTAADANAPGTSPRPEARPFVGRAAEIDRAVTAAILGVRPATVPVDEGTGSAAVSLRRVTGTTPRVSPRPELRPENLRRRSVVRASGMVAVRPKLTGETQLLCGAEDIVGERIAPIQGRIAGCGVEDPVRVRAVAGVALSQPSVMDCRTAMSLRFWVQSAVKPVLAKKGGGVTQLRVASHYSCRTRNNQRGAKISEHGKGRAIDISGFRLANGQEISVLRGWTDNNGATLRKLHGAACGPFGTVLGPNADRFHRDHFHFDTARYRSGTYCR